MSSGTGRFAPALVQQAKERLQQVGTLNAELLQNAERLQAIGNRIRLYLTGTPGLVPSSKDFANLIFAFARGIDYALANGDVPKMAGEIPGILRKVYQLRKDTFLQRSIVVFIITCKNACYKKWFQLADYSDILRMANELSGNFCSSVSQPANNKTVLEIISTIMPRYYPQFKFKHLVTSVEAKVGYDILMADFFVDRNLPRSGKISLFVVQKDNLDASSCITSPQHVSFLVNGKGVDKRTNVLMETGPQFPSDITKMLKYGTNILQAVGYFDANYIIAVASVNNAMSFDAPKLDDYAQPVTADLPDSDILEGPSRVPLKCPISFGRIKTPIKGRLCKHFQCFDYDNYMEMNLRKPTWRCPVCSTPSNFIDLRIDQKMAKVLKETGDDIIDVLVFPDGSWKAVSVHDEKSDRHADAGHIIQQSRGDTAQTDSAPSDIIDLIDENDDGDMPMTPVFSSEDIKPVLNSRDLPVADYLPDLLTSTTAQPVNLFLGGGDTGFGNGTSTSWQNALRSSSGPDVNSFLILESNVPRYVMQPGMTDAVSISPEASLLDLPSTQQGMLNTPRSHPHSQITGLAETYYMGTGLPTGGPEHGRGANVYGAHPAQQQQHLGPLGLRNSLIRSQTVSRSATPQATPHVQSPGLAYVAATPNTPHCSPQEISMDESWQPTGQMRGSLTGSAYNQALERYMKSVSDEQARQARPHGDPHRR